MTTGDLLLVSGHGVFSNVIKNVMGVPWSHLAMVLELEQTYVWEATGHGVMESTWANYIKGKFDFLTRLVNPGAGDVAIRKLEWPSKEVYDGAIVKLAAHCNEMRGRAYEANKVEMLNVSFPWLGPHLFGRTIQDLTTVFCWECVAAAWQAMGLLPAERPANSYAVTEFMGDMPLLLGVKLGPIEQLNA